MDSKPIFDEIFQRVSKGNIISPRGSKVIEVENFMYELPPYVKFQNYDVRKLKFNYIKQELLWYLRHNVHDTSIVNFASIWKDLIQPNGTINSNYGAHLFDTVKTNRSSSQFLNVVDILRKDADSRRASMVILTDSHLLCDIDVPCTYSLNFRIRNNKLNMTVHMRSQDAIFGMGNDAPAFSMIHEMVLNMLEADYPELTLGNYTHFADSFHVYERHFELLEKIVSGEATFTEIEIPKIANKNEVLFMLTDLHRFYELGRKYNNYVNSKLTSFNNDDVYISQLEEQPINSNFLFSKWLLTKENE
jgi:thymidylate synthase